MVWMSTLENMVAYEAHVIQTCGACGWWAVTDLAAMVALLGADGSLWDRRPPCEACGGESHFMASGGPGTAKRPLLSPRHSTIDTLPPQAWMGGWTGDWRPGMAQRS